jgi:uncharacterized protein YkwD
MLERMPRRLLICVLCALAAAIAAPVTASALAPTRASGLAGYRGVQQDARVGAGWTGTTAGCVAGAESPASLAATLHTVNTLRSFAGVAPVVFDDQFNRQALDAALMMRAADSVDHTPGPDWPCYSADGREAARRSNLAVGLSGAAAIVGYMNDAGLAELGHRRWILDPETTAMGSGSTGTSNALFVISGGYAPVPPTQAVSWPPAGWVPWQWIYRDWSLAIGATGQDVSFQSPSVAVTIDGAPVAVGGVTVLDLGYGSGQTLKWQVDVGRQLTSGDHTIAVAVSGAVVNGQPLPITWTTNAFQPDPPPPKFVRGPRILRPGGPGSAVRAGQRLVASAEVTGGTITARRWQRDGRTIVGASYSTYRVRRRDRGHVLAVRVTASAVGGAPATTRTSLRVHVRD